MRVDRARGRNLWLLLALAVAGLIGWGMATTWGVPYAGVVWDGNGVLVGGEAGGPADRVGLKPGDRIVAVDGAPPSQFAARLRQAFHSATGEHAVTFTVERGGSSSTPGQLLSLRLSADMIAPQYYLFYLVFALLAIAYWILPLLVLLGAPDSAEARLFYLMGELWAGALAVGMGVPAGKSWGWVGMGILSGVLAPVMVHFHLVFPQRLWRPRPWLLVVLYAAGLVIGLRWIRTPLGYPSWSVGWTMTNLWLGLGFLSAVVLVVVSYVAARSPSARQRIRLVAFGTVLGFAPFGILTVLTGLVSEMWTMPFMIALPAAYAVAVWRYNLMGFDRLLRRGLVYLLVSGLLFGAYFAALTTFHALVPMRTAGQAALAAAVALLAAVTFRPLRDRVQRLVDRLFYGGWYEYRGLVEEVGASLARTLDAEALAEVLVRRVPEAMHLPGAGLWLEQEGRTALIAQQGIGASVEDRNGASCSAPTGHVTITAESAVVPLVVEGRLVGTWLLAGRLSEGWGPEDARILTALGQQAALAAQNVRLIAELRAKVTEVEAMHRRLLAAREEERAELSRELHDGVIQDLVGVRYRLEALAEEGGAGRQPVPLGELHERVGLLIDELRRLCADLRPPVLDQLGLAAALRTLSREVTARGLPVEAHLEDLSLPEGTDIGLYRIAQEALSNALRHAGASCAQVSLRRDGNDVVLGVADDGHGFDPSSVRARAGRFGLLGMAERAQALRGRLQVESLPGEGTRITVRCPFFASPPPTP